MHRDVAQWHQIRRRIRKNGTPKRQISRETGVSRRTAVEKAGLSGLNEGQVVEYDEVANKGKSSAENLKVQR
jgi:hypothetical protein